MISSDEDEPDDWQRKAGSLEGRLKDSFAEHVGRLAIQRARSSCVGCDIDDPSQIPHMRDCLCPPEELVNRHFGEVINDINSSDMFKKWLRIFEDFEFLWQLEAVERQELMPWLYGDWSQAQWTTEMQQLVKDSFE